MKLDELAKIAGVSRTTVSYVVNGKAKEYRVSDKTIQKVTALIEQYQYKPNAIAAGLRAGKTHTIGLIIPDFENSSYARIANALENRCREHGYQLIITCSNDNPANEKDCAKNLFLRKVDALIVSTCLANPQDFYPQTVNKTPIVYLDRPSQDTASLMVLSDDEQDAYHLAQRLLQSHKKMNNLLFLGALSELPVSQQRQAGFARLTQEYGINANLVYAEQFSKEAASQAFQTWIDQHGMPDSIFVTSLTLLRGIFLVLLNHYQSIPKSINIATFGNHEMLDLIPNLVICAEQNHSKIVDTLWQLIDKKLNKKKALQVDNITVIPRHLLVRNI
ncbi:LacI family transcriptional regulator [Volucribacter psittacicida]|uniref:LacI family transcriptional regulator n=1 Tax=Volucribacter psittacicida TaxID=203482 RepID=A0A4R1G138_9PAST|nr:catabolite repressor/activator [Volucribacter psittacicida]TCK01787.1 LacI family transcriptional regulator [Volucribacter psittacicida]